MKKIVFFSKNMDIGGMETALVNLLNNLKDKYEITLILEEKKGVLLDRLDTKIKVDEYKLSSNKILLIRKIINFTKRIKWHLFNKNKYSFSCNYATYSIIGSRLAQIASKNSCLYVHSDYYNFFSRDKDQVINFFESHKLSGFSNIIFVSNECMDNIKNLFPKSSEKFTVINNFIDFENVEVLSNEEIDFKIFPKEKINFLFIGRLDNTSKNFDLLISSFKKAFDKNKNVHLNILGDGPYKENIITLINKNDMQQCVSLLGEKKNPYPYMRMCDSVILTSKYEGFPVIYLEALKLNKKFITTVKVSDDNIDISDYFIVVDMKPDKIADAILSIDKKTIKYDVDFQMMNEKNFSKLEKIIEKEW